MGRKGTLAAAIAGTLTICAIAVSGASAAKPHLMLEANGAVLAVGAPIQGSNSEPWLLETNAGNVSCASSTVGGTVAVNGGSKPPALSIAENTLDGGPGSEGICESTFAPPLNEPVVAKRGTLPWKLTLSMKEASLSESPTWTVKPADPPPPPHGAVGCIYGAGSLKAGVFPINGEPLDVVFTKWRIARKPDSSKECNVTHPVLSLGYTFTSGGFPVVAVVR
jgi:hypothetical protein